MILKLFAHFLHVLKIKHKNNSNLMHENTEMFSGVIITLYYPLLNHPLYMHTVS
jgi:hypothetical protein